MIECSLPRDSSPDVQWFDCVGSHAPHTISSPARSQEPPYKVSVVTSHYVWIIGLWAEQIHNYNVGQSSLFLDKVFQASMWSDDTT
jgi:hypothetical protein